MKKQNDRLINESSFVIKYNNAAVNESCFVCGARTDPQVPLAIFSRDGLETSCEACNKKYVPEMAKALELFYSNAQAAEQAAGGDF